MKIAILTNGYISDYKFYEAMIDKYDLLICADGGLKHALKMDAHPQVAIGDFDSTPKHIVELFSSRGTKIKKYNTIKNETDTEIALHYAIGKMPDSIEILAGLGDRIDHSLANIHLLKQAVDKNIKCKIVTESHEIIANNSCVKIYGDAGDGVSLLPLTEEVTGVYTKGLAYAVNNGNFELGTPYGTSNYMSGSEAEIKLANGILLIIRYKE